MDRLSNNDQFDFVKQFFPNNDDDSSNIFFDADDNPYVNSNISTYLDESEFTGKYSNNSNLIFYSLNIQSLSSKFNEFNEHICALNEKKCGPDVICLQETWKIPNSSVFNIQGYSELFVKSRHSKQGGGVGFYFKNSVKFKLVNEKSIFVDQILESIVAEIFLPCNKKAVVFQTCFQSPHPNTE